MPLYGVGRGTYIVSSTDGVLSCSGGLWGRERVLVVRVLRGMGFAPSICQVSVQKLTRGKPGGQGLGGGKELLQRRRDSERP